MQPVCNALQAAAKRNALEEVGFANTTESYLAAPNNCYVTNVHEPSAADPLNDAKTAILAEQ